MIITASIRCCNKSLYGNVVFFSFCKTSQSFLQNFHPWIWTKSFLKYDPHHRKLKAKQMFDDYMHMLILSHTILWFFASALFSSSKHASVSPDAIPHILWRHSSHFIIYPILCNHPIPLPQTTTKGLSKPPLSISHPADFRFAITDATAWETANKWIQEHWVYRK